MGHRRLDECSIGELERALEVIQLTTITHLRYGNDETQTSAAV
jgi:hypothetical protein